MQTHGCSPHCCCRPPPLLLWQARKAKEEELRESGDNESTEVLQRPFSCGVAAVWPDLKVSTRPHPCLLHMLLILAVALPCHLWVSSTARLTGDTDCSDVFGPGGCGRGWQPASLGLDCEGSPCCNHTWPPAIVPPAIAVRHLPWPVMRSDPVPSRIDSCVLPSPHEAPCRLLQCTQRWHALAWPCLKPPR